MTLEEYTNGLIKFGKDNPQLLTSEVVTSCDDEGNDYNNICFTRFWGKFEVRGEYISAVCVN